METILINSFYISTAICFVLLPVFLVRVLALDKKTKYAFLLLPILLLSAFSFDMIMSISHTEVIGLPTVIQEFSKNNDKTELIRNINDMLGFHDSGFEKHLTYHIDDPIYEIDHTLYRFGNFHENGSNSKNYFFVTLNCDKIYIVGYSYIGTERYAAHYTSDLTNGKYTNAFDKVTGITDYYGGIRYQAYAKRFPLFALLDLSRFDNTYLLLNDKENNASVIYCYNDLESINIFQVGDHFCIYQGYNECYMGVSMCHNISDSKTERYAFRMVRYFSTGGQTVCDLIIMEIGKQKKLYAFTVEEYYDTIESKVKTTYDKATNTILIATESGSDKITRDFYGETHTGTIQKEIDNVYVDPKQWYIKHDADTGRIEVSAGIIVIFKDGKFTSYHDEYQWIGSVNAEVTFVNGEFFLGKTTFKSF